MWLLWPVWSWQAPDQSGHDQSWSSPYWNWPDWSQKTQKNNSFRLLSVVILILASSIFISGIAPLRHIASIDEIYRFMLDLTVSGEVNRVILSFRLCFAACDLTQFTQTWLLSSTLTWDSIARLFFAYTRIGLGYLLVSKYRTRSSLSYAIY